MSNDVFEDIQSRLKMLEQPHLLSNFHFIGLVHFAAEAAENLMQINCDGRHTLWAKYATHPIVKKVIASHCRYQPVVCESLLALPHNPLTPSVLHSFTDSKAVFALERILKNLMERKAPQESLRLVANEIEALASVLPLQTQQDLAARIMETGYLFPLVDPSLTVESFNRVQHLKQKFKPHWDRDFIHAVAMKVGRAVTADIHTIEAAQYYIDHLDRFEEKFYDTVLQYLGWNSEQIELDIPQLVAALNQRPGFEKWLDTIEQNMSIQSNKNQYMSVVQLLISERQNLVLRSVVNCAKQQSSRKI